MLYAKRHLKLIIAYSWNAQAQISWPIYLVQSDQVTFKVQITTVVDNICFLLFIYYFS